MSIDSALQRVSTISQALADPAALVGSSTLLSGGTPAPAEASTGSPSFASALQSASSAYPEASPAASASTATASLPSSAPAALTTGAPGSPGTRGVTSPTGLSLTGDTGQLAGIAPSSPLSTPAAANVGERIVAIAQSQLGQTEQPPGSNESPAIAQYRSATVGAEPGAPWCAYFASWAARQAGEPLGAEGQGLGSVAQIWSWAQSTGRALVNGPGVVPKPGDLIVFGDEHVGIVKGVRPDGSIETIEGNYNNQVSANVRPAGEASGYVSMS
jgi:CHAP domain